MKKPSGISVSMFVQLVYIWIEERLGWLFPHLLVVFLIFSSIEFYGIRFIFGLCDGTCGSAGYICLTTFGTNACVQRHTLAYHLTVLPIGFGLLMEHVLHLVTPNSGSGGIGIDSGRRLKGDARIIGAVLIFALLTGLTAAVLCGFLCAFYACCLIGAAGFCRRVYILNPHPYGHFRRIIAYTGRNIGAFQGRGGGIAGHMLRGSLHTGFRILG